MEKPSQNLCCISKLKDLGSCLLTRESNGEEIRPYTTAVMLGYLLHHLHSLLHLSLPKICNLRFKYYKNTKLMTWVSLGCPNLLAQTNSLNLTQIGLKERKIKDMARVCVCVLEMIIQIGSNILLCLYRTD